MGNNPISDVDREVIGWVARAYLRYEEKVPRAVVGRVSLRGGRQGNNADRGCQAEQRGPHRHISEALLASSPVYAQNRVNSCPELL